MLRTISEASRRAHPGDVITVHEGVYRERVDPPRGGTSEHERIVYQAALGEEVIIKGSECLTGWERVEHDTWKVTLPNTYFGDFNPYSDSIHGDWFHPKGREHHSGAIYLDGHWLTEAATKAEVLEEAQEAPLWFAEVDGSGYLLNVAWIQSVQPALGPQRIAATSYSDQEGVQNAPSSEGAECIGWIEDGDWVRYESVNFGERCESVELRAASVTGGGRIELRLGDREGELIGVCTVADTGGWQAWKSFTTAIKPTSGKQTLCLVFRSHEVPRASTTLWAQFKGIDPNQAEVEFNVRRAVFYPQTPGIDYLTVRGFSMRHAATPWAPPTAEQVGLIGTHWSKGWIIEDNDIAYSTCVGITLGKYGDAWDNRSQSADAYNRTIERALENGWSGDQIGHHVVRDNRISHCEQAGIVGSLGAVFSTITGNVIHDIHVRKLFTGAEMAGIKIHAAIDMQIIGNHIFRTCRGIWLDWMAQGTRVSGNLLHDNDTGSDLFVEVNHGPFLVDNNLFLSPSNLLDWYEGGAYVHNLFAGKITARPELSRATPYHKAHSTELAGLRNIAGGDNRFYNNLFVHTDGLAAYEGAAQPVLTAGNVFLAGAEAFDHGLVELGGGLALHLSLADNWAEGQRFEPVTSERLGKALIPDLPYARPDGAPHDLERDFNRYKRERNDLLPGPFAVLRGGQQILKVWPPSF